MGKVQIETKRMVIRNFVQSDLADLFEILGDAETMESLEPPYDEAKTAEFLENFCIRQGGALAAELKDSGKVIGYILFKPCGGEGVFEMGWVFNKSFWRRGLALEGCGAVVEFGFKKLGAHKIFAETIDSIKSSGLAEKLGMKPEGLLRKHTKNNRGEWSDVHLYGVLKEEFEDEA